MRKELRPTHDQIACDVCERTILKGERTEAFLAPGGQRKTVCELCTDRAHAEGWIRESAHGDLPASLHRLARQTRHARKRELLWDSSPLLPACASNPCGLLFQVALVLDSCLHAGQVQFPRFVVEFEHWSGHGDIDGAWLLRRGH